jgi:hypothetical protein
VSQLVASLADFLLVVEDAVHRADRAEVLPLVQKRRVDLGRGLIGKRLAVEHVEDLPTFLFRERPRRFGPWRRGGHRRRGPTTAVERCPGHAHAATGRRGAHLGRKLLDGLHGILPLPCGGRGIPSTSESFS